MTEQLEFEESIASLKDDIYRLEPGGVVGEHLFTTLSGQDQYQFEYETIRILVDFARAVYLKNPLIRRSVDIQSLIIFGQGFTVDLDDDPEAKKFADMILEHEFFGDYENLFKTEVELQISGNTFLKIERVDEDVPYDISVFPMEEVTDYIYHPDYPARMILVKREWMRTEVNYTTGEKENRQVQMWYPVDPHKNFFMKPIPLKIGDETVSQTSAVFHVKTGSFPHWKWGVSEVYPALDWAIAYKDFLTDVIRIMRAHSEFAWEGTTAGSIEAFQNKMRAELMAARQGEATGEERREHVFIHQPGSDLSPMNVRHAGVDPDDGRRILHMVAAATGLSEIYYGDANVGNHATAAIVERPTELMFRSRQMLWISIFKKVLDYIFQTEKMDVAGKLNITFPDITEHDIKDRIEAIIQATTLDGHIHANMITREATARIIMRTLDIDDPEAHMEELRKIWEKMDKDKEELRKAQLEQIEAQTKMQGDRLKAQAGNSMRRDEPRAQDNVRSSVEREART